MVINWNIVNSLQKDGEEGKMILREIIEDVYVHSVHVKTNSSDLRLAGCIKIISNYIAPELTRLEGQYIDVSSLRGSYNSINEKLTGEQN